MVSNLDLSDVSLFRSAFLSAGHGMALVDLDGRFRAVNPALCGIVQRTPEELYALRFHDITHPDDLPADIDRVNRLLSGEIHDFETEKRYRRRDGTWVSIQLNVGLVRGENGEPSYLVAHMVDLSGHKAALADVAAARDKREAAYVKMVETIARVVEKGDPYTAGHQGNVAEVAACIAETLGLDPYAVKSAYVGGLLHDLGKVYVPSQILSKPGRLTAAEIALLREHPAIGHDILSRADVPWPVATIVHQHHERMNGEGYPSRLPGPEICMAARIVTVADVYESMASFRPYRAAFGWEKALAELEMNAGNLYDPDVVAACATRARAFAADATDSKLARAFHVAG